MHSDRIRRESLLDKIVSAEEAARFIKNGMTIGMSGFTRAGEAKAVPLALAERAAHQELKITLMTGASLGNDLDRILTQAGVLARRLPFQSDPVLRGAINAGEVMFIDQHLSETVRIAQSWENLPTEHSIAHQTDFMIGNRLGIQLPFSSERRLKLFISGNHISITSRFTLRTHNERPGKIDRLG